MGATLLSNLPAVADATDSPKAAKPAFIAFKRRPFEIFNVEFNDQKSDAAFFQYVTTVVSL